MKTKKSARSPVVYPCFIRVPSVAGLLHGADGAQSNTDRFAVAAGGLYLSPGVSRPVVEAWVAGKGGRDTLSPREREVLRLIAAGRSTKEIAVVLGISVKTADSHRTRLMDKLDLHDTASLVRYSIRRRLIEP